MLQQHCQEDQESVKKIYTLSEERVL